VIRFMCLGRVFILPSEAGANPRIVRIKIVAS
jgi:hypothetical protein